LLYACSIQHRYNVVLFGTQVGVASVDLLHEEVKNELVNGNANGNEMEMEMRTRMGVGMSRRAYLVAGRYPTKTAWNRVHEEVVVELMELYQRVREDQL